MINIDLLKTFVTVVDLGSFNRAADELFTSKATISIRMSNLINDVGFDPFVKKYGSIILTERGQQLLEISRGILELENKISALSYNNHVNSQIRIVSGNSILVRRFLTPIMDFQKYNPNIQLIVEGAPVSLISGKLSRGTADLGISWENLPPNQHILKEKLCSLHFGALCNINNQIAKNESISMNDIIKNPMIVKNMTTYSRKIIDLWFKKRMLNPSILLEVNSNEDVVTAIEKGYGGDSTIGILTELCNYNPEKYKWVLINDLKPMEVFAYTRADADNANIRRLIDYFKKT